MEDVLVDYNLCDCRRERTSTRALEEEVLREVHILVDAKPFADSRMILHKVVNDVVLAYRTL